MDISLNLKDLEIKIIQGGMGVSVSDYNLARAVSLNKYCLGVVSGTTLNEIMVRKLQRGDPTGEIREALSTFPDQNTVDKIIETFFKKESISEGESFKTCPFPRFTFNSNNEITLNDSFLEKMIIAANYVEVKLAKKGHSNPVGINYLHKIQWPLIPSIYGAMLADVDFVLIGAGFPREIAKVLDQLVYNKRTTMTIPVEDNNGRINNNYNIVFNPEEMPITKEILKRPHFLGIVANHLGIKGLPDVDGYIFEKCDDVSYDQVAGGHNPPCRNGQLTAKGEPDYGEKDGMNYKLLKSLLIQNAKKRAEILGLNPEDEDVIETLKQPYWFAGGYADKLENAIENGAQGIQVGTPFAFSRESGIESKLKRKILKQIIDGAEVYTSPVASPSGFPFKVVLSDDTIAANEIYEKRNRLCNLGYLIELFIDGNNIKGRCPAEPSEIYERKRGNALDCEGRVCLCNSLISTAGLGSPNEPPIVTAGSNLDVVKELVKRHGFDYTAKDVIDYVFH
jgi:nitronate monooxygenase